MSELNRIRELAGLKPSLEYFGTPDVGIITESVMAVPGLNEKSSSEKQARFMAAAAHNPEFAKKAGIDSSVAKEFNQADAGTKQLSNAMKHKTNEDTESDMQTTGTVGRNQDYAAFDQSQGMATESVPAIDSCNQNNPANADAACAMEAEMDPLQYSIQRLEQLSKNNPADLDSAFEIIRQELLGKGIPPEAVQGILRAAEEDMYNKASQRASDGLDESESDPQYERFHQRFTDLMNSYVEPQEAFDVISRELDELGIDGEQADIIMQQLEQDFFPDSGFDHMGGPGDFSDDAEALASAGHGSDEDYGSAEMEFEEAFDLQNGYDDIHDASGNDYFPNGADGPVVRATGPSGARQGDNPEQKRMQVAEVHKELVYSYRSFLGESAKSKKKVN